MNQPLVSFIIPYYNAGTTIQETIDSIYNQSYTNYDIWLINDGSTDTFSIEKLKDFMGNEKIHILHQENLGPGSARNKGILISKADFFVFLDSDDLIEPETINFSIENIGDNDVLFGDCFYFGERTGIKKQILPSKKEILIGNPIAICLIVKSSVIKDILFDTKLDQFGLEDWELLIHLFSKDYKFIYFDKIFFRIKVNKDSRTFQVANNNIQTITKYVFNKHSEFLYEMYNEVFYEKKQLMNNIEYKIGKFILHPYRILKQLIKIK